MKHLQLSRSNLSLRLLLVIALLAVSIAGCGQKGGLTRPDQVQSASFNG
ncbi:MAG: lipoprotein [Gammaproteobacteria bacterium]|nr:lipoprotein [Gammaproteobacteria bacterium]MCY4356424.1 lipoprotein [Gammaproteobacteria bacterium]